MTLTKGERARQRKASIASRRKRKRSRESNCVIRIDEDGKEPTFLEESTEIIITDEEAEARQLVTDLSRTFAKTLCNHPLK